MWQKSHHSQRDSHVADDQGPGLWEFSASLSVKPSVRERTYSLLKHSNTSNLVFLRWQEINRWKCLSSLSCHVMGQTTNKLEVIVSAVRAERARST